MYAVIRSGGKQDSRVSPGEKVKVESIDGAVGAAVSLDQVLAVGEGENVRVGRPLVEGALVKATIVGHGRGDKVRIFKLRRRKGSRTHKGHRQNYTELSIESIDG